MELKKQSTFALGITSINEDKVLVTGRTYNVTVQQGLDELTVTVYGKNEISKTIYKIPNEVERKIR